MVFGVCCIVCCVLNVVLCVAYWRPVFDVVVVGCMMLFVDLNMVVYCYMMFGVCRCWLFVV